MTTTARVSRHIVRACERYLRERIGDAGFEALAAATDKELGDGDWVPLQPFLTLLRACEARYGDPATLQLLRETARLTMAAAVARSWAAFLSGTTSDELLTRAGAFWSLSYDTGKLVVVNKSARHCRLAVEGWPDPPREVAAMLAEACVVFLVRLGERSGRAVDEIVSGRLEVDVVF
jgi:hypothetical protein